MSDLFAGSCIGAYIPADGNVTDAVSSNWVDTAFVRCGISVLGNATYAESFHHATSTDFWMTFDIHIDTTFSEAEINYVSLYNSSDVEVYRLGGATVGGTTTFKQYTSPDGSAWTQRGSSFTALSDNRHTFSIHLNTDGTGAADVYVSGTRRLDYSGDLSALTNVEYHRFRSSGYTVFSQVVCRNGNSTIGARIREFYPSGAGATDQWTGSHTAVDESEYSDANFIWSDTANQVEVMAGTLVGSLTGYVISSVAVVARAKTDGSGPQNLQLALRTASTNYFSGSIALGAGYSANVGIWEDNPNTTLDWTSADATAIQIGAKSIA
jgi:hypothetical protein